MQQPGAYAIPVNMTHCSSLGVQRAVRCRRFMMCLFQAVGIDVEVGRPGVRVASAPCCCFATQCFSALTSAASSSCATSASSASIFLITRVRGTAHHSFALQANYLEMRSAPKIFCTHSMPIVARCAPC